MSKKSASTNEALSSIVSDMKNKLGFMHKKINHQSQNKHNFDLNSEDQEQALQLFQNQQIHAQSDHQDDHQQVVQKVTLKNLLKCNPMIQEKQEQKKGNKSVSFNFDDNIIYTLSADRKWNDKIENQKKGKFQMNQQKILSDAVGQYIVANQINFDQFIKWLSASSKEERHILRREKFFKLLSSVLPNRSPESCYKYIMRNFNELNHKGKWTAEDEQKLITLVQKYGRKWTLIGKKLGRTSDNVYDKYRSLGQQNAEQRVKKLWKLREIVSMLFQIQRQTQIQFLDHKIKQQLQKQAFHDEIEEKELTQHKYNSKKFTFHNIEIIKRYIDSKLLQSINLDSLKWKKIMKQVGNKTIFDCRNKIVTILQLLFRNNQSLDSSLVAFLKAENPQEQNRINWRKWNYDQYTAQQAKNRFMILKKLIQGRTSKPFQTIMLEICDKVKKISERPKQNLIKQKISQKSQQKKKK